MPFVPIPPRWAFDPNEENNSSVRKIASPDMAQFERSNLIVSTLSLFRFPETIFD